MQSPQGSTIALAVLLPLIAWRVYARFRRMVGRQRLTKYRLRIQLTLFPSLVVLIALGAAARPAALLALAASLAVGALLGRYGIRTTRFEAVPGNLFYTPNAHLGIALSTLFVLRIAYRLLEVYALQPSVGRSGAEFARSPLTLFVFGLLAGYYISYAVGLAAWRAGVLAAKRRRIEAEQERAEQGEADQESDASSGPRGDGIMAARPSPGRNPSTHDRRAHLDRQRLPQLQLPDRLRRERRGAGDRSARSREVPERGARQGLADHADPQHPRAPRPHGRQCGRRRGDRRQADRAPSRRLAHRRRRPRRQGRRRDQGRQDASSSNAWTRRATRCATSACARTPTSRRCSRATRCSTPAPATATTAATPEALYATFVDQLAKLPGETRVYPGHDYIENNLRFTLAREPDNGDAKALLPEVSGHDPATMPVTTLDEEKRINAFMRLASPSLVAALRDAFPELPEHPDAKTVFVKLRELRNRW